MTVSVAPMWHFVKYTIFVKIWALYKLPKITCNYDLTYEEIEKGIKEIRREERERKRKEGRKEKDERKKERKDK